MKLAGTHTLKKEKRPNQLMARTWTHQRTYSRTFWDSQKSKFSGIMAKTLELNMHRPFTLPICCPAMNLTKSAASFIISAVRCGTRKSNKSNELCQWKEAAGTKRGVDSILVPIVLLSYGEEDAADNESRCTYKCRPGLLDAGRQTKCVCAKEIPFLRISLDQKGKAQKTPSVCADGR